MYDEGRRLAPTDWCRFQELVKTGEWSAISYKRLLQQPPVDCVSQIQVLCFG